MLVKCRSLCILFPNDGDLVCRVSELNLHLGVPDQALRVVEWGLLVWQPPEIKARLETLKASLASADAINRVRPVPGEEKNPLPSKSTK